MDEVIQVEPGREFRLPLADKVLRGEDQDVGTRGLEEMLTDHRASFDGLS
jgi:hypothetical protein